MELQEQIKNEPSDTFLDEDKNSLSMTPSSRPGMSEDRHSDSTNVADDKMQSFKIEDWSNKSDNYDNMIRQVHDHTYSIPGNFSRGLHPQKSHVQMGNSASLVSLVKPLAKAPSRKYPTEFTFPAPKKTHVIDERVRQKLRLLQRKTNCVSVMYNSYVQPETGNQNKDCPNEWTSGILKECGRQDRSHPIHKENQNADSVMSPTMKCNPTPLINKVKEETQYQTSEQCEIHFLGNVPGSSYDPQRAQQETDVRNKISSSVTEQVTGNILETRQKGLNKKAPKMHINNTFNENGEVNSAEESCYMQAFSDVPFDELVRTELNFRLSCSHSSSNKPRQGEGMQEVVMIDIVKHDHTYMFDITKKMKKKDVDANGYIGNKLEQYVNTLRNLSDLKGKYHSLIIIGSLAHKRRLFIMCGFCLLEFEGLDDFKHHFTNRCKYYKPGALPVQIYLCSFYTREIPVCQFLCAYCNDLFTFFGTCTQHMSRCACMLQTFRMNGSYVNLEVYLLPQCKVCHGRMTAHGCFKGMGKIYLGYQMKKNEYLFCKCRGLLDFEVKVIEQEKARKSTASVGTKRDLNCQTKHANVLSRNLSIPLCSSFLGTHFLLIEYPNSHKYTCGFCKETYLCSTMFNEHTAACSSNLARTKLPICISSIKKVNWWGDCSGSKAGFMCGYCIRTFIAFDNCLSHMEQCQFSDKHFPNIQFALLKICHVCHGKKICALQRADSMLEMVEEFQVIYKKLNVKFYICDISCHRSYCNMLNKKRPEIKKIVPEDSWNRSENGMNENENCKIERDAGTNNRLTVSMNTDTEIKNTDKNEKNDNVKKLKLDNDKFVLNASTLGDTVMDEMKVCLKNIEETELSLFGRINFSTVMQCTNENKDNSKDVNIDIVTDFEDIDAKVDDDCITPRLQCESDEIGEGNTSDESRVSNTLCVNIVSDSNNIGDGEEATHRNNRSRNFEKHIKASSSCDYSQHTNAKTSEEKKVNDKTDKHKVSVFPLTRTSGTIFGLEAYFRNVQVACICQDEQCRCKEKIAYHEINKLDNSFHCGFCWEKIRDTKTFFQHILSCRLANEHVTLPVRLVRAKVGFLCGFCTSIFPKLCSAAHHMDKCAKTFPCIDSDTTLGNMKYRLLKFCFKHKCQTFNPHDDDSDKQFALYLEGIREHAQLNICDCGKVKKKTYLKYCCFCREKFTNEILHSVHLDNHYSQSDLCHICGKVFGSKGMPVHLRMIHRVSFRGELLPPRQKRLGIKSQCHLCGRILGFRECLKRHLKYACKLNDSRIKRNFKKRKLQRQKI